MALRSVLVRAAEDFRRRCVAQSLARTFRSPFATAGVYLVCFLVFGSEFWFFFLVPAFWFLSLSLSLLAVSFSQQPFCMYVACLFFISFTFVLLLILFCEIFVAVFRFPSLSCSFFPSFFPVGTGRLMAAPSPLLLDLAVCWMLLLSC